MGDGGVKAAFREVEMMDEWINVRIPRKLKEELEELKVHRRQGIWEVIDSLVRKVKSRKKEGGK